MQDDLRAFWSPSEDDLLSTLQSSRRGLSTTQALATTQRYGKNLVKQEARHTKLALAWHQVSSPIAILLTSAAILSSIVGDTLDGITILTILIMSALLGYWQELRAHTAVYKLLEHLERKTKVMRDGRWQQIPSADIVPGDIISLDAGAQIPADCRVIESQNLTLDQSALTGESFPSDKRPGICPLETPLGDRTNSVFMGSHVLSGDGIAVAVLTGRRSLYGKLIAELRRSPPPTEFELGVRHFGYFLLEVALALSLVVFAINISFERPTLESLLFTLALVVGMTPQLLPAIVTTTLAHGAHTMASKQTIVRRLNAIADLGGITVLCTDKTGTLTEGIVHWESAISFDGEMSQKTALYGYLNALHETGFLNVIDEAIRAAPVEGASSFRKLDEIPYNFNRRMLSVLVESAGAALMITKGALKEVLQVCDQAEAVSDTLLPLAETRASIEKTFEELSHQGKRCLGVAYRSMSPGARLSQDSEKNLVFVGFLTFSDPAKATAVDSLQQLENYGITCKIVTGDNRHVAGKLAADLGVLEPNRLMTGDELDTLTDHALRLRVLDIDIFAEMDPNQKERIILAFKRAGVGVAYLGDGINDAAALHAADVGISVDTAVDVTKEAADVVLLNKDLRVIIEAVKEGRRAFANTLKYIAISTSANFGNMFSVAGASLFAAFLPMLPKQILLLNVLADLPAMALATDRVDAWAIKRPLRWNSQAIGKFMVIFGLISSVFDYLTFGILLILAVPALTFRTAWFVESALSQLLMLLVIRTHGALWRSHIGNVLLSSCLIIGVVTILLPYSPLATPLGFTPLPSGYLIFIALILTAYVGAAEFAKKGVRRTAP